MLRLRPFKKEDADTIISWSKDEKAFYQWSAGVMGEQGAYRAERPTIERRKIRGSAKSSEMDLMPIFFCKIIYILLDYDVT